MRKRRIDLTILFGLENVLLQKVKLLIRIITVRSKVTKTFSSPELFALVSNYMKTSPIYGKLVLRFSKVGELVFVDFEKTCDFAPIFLSRIFSLHFCGR